jgi:hypothetical protein
MKMKMHMLQQLMMMMKRRKKKKSLKHPLMMMLLLVSLFEPLIIARRAVSSTLLEPRTRKRVSRSPHPTHSPLVVACDDLSHLQVQLLLLLHQTHTEPLLRQHWTIKEDLQRELMINADQLLLLLQHLPLMKHEIQS